MVPLAEAWNSGASQWTAARRQAYANDLGAERSLVAVTAKSNRSKADQDPAQWMPQAAMPRRPVSRGESGSGAILLRVGPNAGSGRWAAGARHLRDRRPRHHNSFYARRSRAHFR
ncbi:hypothetical protein TPA0598_13_00210 [Streptomyces lydicamycinicus]|uniref:Uncharacterized protein n=1 Tax=Streptomyces lydicamycinicus TaxID=1546107 RepID=A0A0P4RGF2_9ACTN|nr:hypothetical protein TPA0598_13_00210 [Streptomyces lydicamycinicus]